MHFILFTITCFLAGIVAGQDTATAVSSTLAPRETPGKQWTLDDVSRKPHEEMQVCKWRFTLTESDAGSGFNDTYYSLKCHFKVRAAKYHDCRVGNFGLTSCSADDPDYFVSGGHDKDGMVILAVENVSEQGRAYFAYLDSALDEGGILPPQTAPVTIRN
ncbi:hypothetical protein F4803DRAFT_514672 [Xylaria telfairii]|nr:hypothetical protein F4803DRAFT_514672 [Xylaria telfairii]